MEDQDGRDVGDAGAQGVGGHRHRSQVGGHVETGVVGTGKEVEKGSGLLDRNSGQSRGPQMEEGRGCGLRSNPA